jgi:hypothetical protein
MIDIVNPVAPIALASIISTSPAAGTKLVRLTWASTVYNGKYHVSRLSPSGNWTKIGSVTSNGPTVHFDVPDALPVNDEDGDPVHYRFRVGVENSAGLLNLVDSPIVVRLDLI